MKLLKKHAVMPEFNMLALLDIIFIIIIFCIIGMTRMVFLELIDVENPRLHMTQNAKPENFITITIEKNGKLFLNKEPVLTQKELSMKLSRVKESRNNITIIINGDKDVPLGDVLSLLQSAREIGLTKVYFKAEGEKINETPS